MKAVVIIPTYNERGNIERIVPITEEVFKKIKNYEMAILVADDNSPDGTAELVKDLSKKYNNIELSQGERQGLGAAYVRGMTHAIEKMGADVVFEMDADLQHDPEKIPEFLAKIDEGYDMAIGDGFKIAEVPFHFGERNIGDSKIAPMSYIANLLRYVITARIKELIFGKFGKFLVVGGFGFVINALVLRALVEWFNWAPAPANLVGAACAIFSNFNFNNLWTFGERRANTVASYSSKLIQFYATSAFGVIFIQTGTDRK